MKINLLLLTIIVSVYVIATYVNKTKVAPSEAYLYFEKIYNDRPEVPSDENLLTFLKGANVVAGEDPIETGKKHLAWLKTQPKPSPAIQEKLPDSDKFQNWNFLRGEAYGWMNRVELPISAEERAKGQRILDDWNALQPEMEARYQQFLTFSKVGTPNYDGVRFDVLDRRGGSISIISDALFKYHYLKLLLDPNLSAETVRKTLTEQFYFAQNLLKQSDMAVWYLMFVKLQEMQFTFGTKLIGQLPIEARAKAIPAFWKKPLTTEAWNFPLLFAIEISDLKWLSNHYEEMYTPTSRYEKIVAKLSSPLRDWQDTLNEQARIYKEGLTLVDMPAYEFNEYYKNEVANLNNKMKHLSLLNWRNPVGRYNMNPYITDLPVYDAGLVRNLEGVRQLALLTAELYVKNVPKNKVGTAVQRSELRNPYTKEPFKWREIIHSLRFEGIEWSVETYYHPTETSLPQQQ